LKVINCQSKHTYIIPKDKKKWNRSEANGKARKLVKIGRLWYHPLIKSEEELKANKK
jgi:hypothetical protein